MVALQNEPLLGLVFHHWVEYTMTGGRFQTLVEWSLWECHQALIALAHYSEPFCEKKEFSSQVSLLHKREHVWNEFQTKEILCTPAGPMEYWVDEGLCCSRHKRGLGGKKTRFAFQSKPLLGLVFHHWVEYTFPGGSFQTLVLCTLWGLHQALMALARYLQYIHTCE